MEPEFCPFCGRAGVEQVAEVAVTGRPYIETTYRCQNEHRWVLIQRQPQRKEPDARSS